MAEKLFAVCGKPIIHSKSPLIFKSLFERNNQKNIYFRILTDSEDDCLRLMTELNISAINATAPLKEKLFSKIENLDKAASVSQSVNCVVKNTDAFSGYSTDHYGVINSLLENGINPENEKFLILGAGGAAAAAVYGLSEYTSKITIVNRTESKAVQLAKRFSVKSDSINNIQKNIDTSTVIISTLPAEANFPEIKIDSNVKAVLDANYKNSVITEKIVSNKTIFIDGENWLINQALPAYKIFTGNKSNFDPVISEKYLSNEETVILTGFMCAGKTTIAKMVAEKTEKIFIDLDNEISKRTGKSIPEIFSEGGQELFRKIESEILEEIIKQKNTIIATGGGIIEKENNRKLIEKYKTIWIYSEPLSAIKRNEGGRPLLNDSDPNDMYNLFNRRKPFYAMTCDVMVENRDIKKTVEAIVEEIS